MECRALVAGVARVQPSRRRRLACAVMLSALTAAGSAVGAAPATDTLMIRGRPQTLHLYGARGGSPVIVSSGDGGWVHLGPQVAEFLAARGCFVVGVDVKAYLVSFTGEASTLKAEQVPGDYAALIDYAARGDTRKPLLVGVSEGAALSVLAAADPSLQSRLAGVIGLGLGDVNELGWRWRDSIIYLTHATPREPTFSTRAVVDRVAPLPLAVIHSTGDEYVPLAEVRSVMDAARDPKRFWLVTASNHRFADNQAGLQARLIEAIAWIAGQPAR